MGQPVLSRKHQQLVKKFSHLRVQASHSFPPPTQLGACFLDVGGSSAFSSSAECCAGDSPMPSVEPDDPIHVAATQPPPPPPPPPPPRLQAVLGALSSSCPFNSRLPFAGVAHSC